jgi:hypothetical protein
MLATRASTRNASRIARSFATVVDTAGVKVAAVDYGQPTSAVTFLIKAGSRFENKPGVAHALKNFGFKVRNTDFVLAFMLKGCGRPEYFDAVCTGNSSGERTVWRCAFYKFVPRTPCSDCRVSARRRVSYIMI